MVKKFDASEYGNSSSKSNTILIDEKWQTLHCSACSNWLHLEATYLDCSIDGVYVQFNDLPTLICANCSRHYLPYQTKLAIKEFLRQAKEKNVLTVNVKRKKKKDARRFEYRNSIRFIYDSWDYDFIPGLQRPWNDGYLTPVFFNKKILLKYLNDPKYCVTYATDTFGSIYRGQTHLIAFGINRNGRVITWLGDLDRLPRKEAAISPFI